MQLASRASEHSQGISLIPSLVRWAAAVVGAPLAAVFAARPGQSALVGSSRRLRKGQAGRCRAWQPASGGWPSPNARPLHPRCRTRSSAVAAAWPARLRLEPSSINRSRGARVEEGYVAPHDDPITSDELAGKVNDRAVRPDERVGDAGWPAAAAADALLGAGAVAEAMVKALPKIAKTTVAT